ncbi:MAG: feruloyl-CoA synthase [Rhodobacteraceae bacterium HLUCCA08]|nr:MAG: feruloyl-CoA synthase [Rhodobacteraceae bacterium HLUCCA08]
MTQPNYLAHEVARTDRADGTILLGCGHDLGPVARCTTDWLTGWAARTPDAVFLAERSGPGWREESYAATLEAVRAIAAALLARELGPDRPILIISGNSVNHGLLTLAAQYVGIPTVPLAEQYALIPEAHGRLAFAADLVTPGLVYAEDGAAFGAALTLDCFDGIEKVLTSKVPGGMTAFATLEQGLPGPEIDAANAAIGPDTLAKILLTSGSTSDPKGVLTTHRMMCTNQAQLAQALPFLTARAPVIVDWLPWNHVFGGSHNFNMMLANGGALYVDDGKPVPPLFDRSVENLSMRTGTIAFNVPVGFARLRDVMRDDAGLRRAYFESLDMLFYAGASLPQDVWADLERMAIEVRGEMPLFTSSWGLTETAPACLLQHEPTQRSGIVGVPLPGIEAKLVPDPGDAGRYDVRVKGPTIFAGYLDAPDKTAEAFDDEGYFITGDAMRFVDPADMALGLRFDGRVSEDFKLSTGIWVRAANLRLDLLEALGGIAQDVIVTGADRDEIGILILPVPGLRDITNVDDGALVGKAAAKQIHDAVLRIKTEGRSAQVRRALILADPPSIAEGEITAKGNLNFRKLLTRRAALLDRLYDDADPATILIEAR